MNLRSSIRADFLKRALFAAGTAGMLLAAAPASAAVIFQDDFESCNLSKTQNGFIWKGSTRAAVNSVNPKGGRCALEFTYQAAPDGSDSFSEQRFYLGAHYPDIWMKYDLFIPANYCHRTQTSSTNNKGFVDMWEGLYTANAGVAMNPNFWADGNCQSTTSMFVSAPQSTDPFFNRGGHHYSSEFLDRYSIRTSDRGKWMEVIIHYKYATAAKNDGVVHIWLTSQGQNRRQTLNMTQGSWYVAGALGFDNGYLLGWANSGFAQETKFYIDNIIFSTDPIGMGLDAPPVVTLNAAPTSVAANGSSTLSWSSTNATACSVASGTWSGAKATSGSQMLSNLAATSTYTLTCTGAGGATSNSVTVLVK